jgi:zinc protease
MKIQELTSKGGVRAWLVEEHAVPLIAMRFSFEGGSAQDPVGKEGVTNFLTVTMDEGAGELNSQEFQRRMEDIAMRMSFEDSKDFIYGSFETLTENRKAAVDLLKSVVNAPRFDADAVDRVRDQLIAGLAYAARDPNKVAGERWFADVFAGHPYGRPSNGTAASLKAITRDDLEAYRKRVFARERLRVVVVGDITAAELGPMLDDIFGALPAKPELAAVPTIVPKASVRQTVVEMNIPQSVAQFGGEAIARDDKDFMPAFVLNHLLGGGGFSSRLMEEVREKRGLAYSVYSYLQPFRHASVFIGGVATKNEEMGRSLDVIRAEFRRVVEDGPTQVELDNAKSYLTGSFALRFDTNAKIANQLLYFFAEGFGIDYVDRRNAEVAAVTLDDVKRAAKRVFANELFVTIVGKPKGIATGG